MQDSEADAPGHIPELLALMPLSARNVLICDGPGLSRAYRAANPTAKITGIGKVDPDSVDLVVQGAVDTLAKSRLGGPFDLIVVNETLGRLADPAQLLDTLADRLAPGAVLVTSYLNDVRWSRMRDRLDGRPVPRDALAPEAVRALIAGAGLTLRRTRPRLQNVPKDAQPWIDGLLRLGRQGGFSKEHMQVRLGATHFVAVASRPHAGEPVPKTVRFHLIELAAMMDVRTTVPAAALAAEPALHVTKASKNLEIPAFGPEGAVILLQRPRMSEPQLLVDFVARCQRRGAVLVIES